jgi:hypothetical protein
MRSFQITVADLIYGARKGGKMRRNRRQHRGHNWHRPDLNIERDRAYLIGRGFVYAVVARGEKRGRVVSAHSSKELADQAAKNFGGKNPAEVVEIATYVLAGYGPNS